MTSCHAMARNTALLGVALLMAASASAQPSDEPDTIAPGDELLVTDPDVVSLDTPPAENPFRPRYQIRVGSDTTLPAGVDGTNGDVTVQRLITEAGVTFTLSKASRLSLGVEHESSFYTFDGTPGITPVDSDPIGYVQQTTLQGRYSTQLNEEVGLAFGGSISTSGEADADFGDSLIGRGFIASNFQVSDRLKLGVGVAVNSRLGNDPIIVPVPSIEYQATNRLTIGTQERGLGARYTLNDEVTLRGSAGVDFRQYRLGSGPAGLDNGIFQETAIRIGAGVDWNPSPRVGVGVDLGLLPYRQLEFQNSDGVRIRRLDTDPSVSVGLSVRMRF